MTLCRVLASLPRRSARAEAAAEAGEALPEPWGLLDEPLEAQEAAERGDVEMAPGGDREGDVDELLHLVAKRALVPRLADAEIEDPPPFCALVPDDLQHEELAGARARDLRIGVEGGEHAAAAGRIHRRAEGREDALAHRQRVQLDRRPRLAETGKTRPVQEGLSRRIGEWVRNAGGAEAVAFLAQERRKNRRGVGGRRRYPVDHRTELAQLLVLLAKLLARVLAQGACQGLLGAPGEDEAVAVAGARPSAGGERIGDAAPGQRQVREGIGVDAEPAAGLPQQGAERGRRGQRRARGHERQVVVRVLAADRARGAEARPALDGERDQKAGAAVAVPDEEHARLEAAALGQSLDIGLPPIEALIGRARPVRLELAPDRLGRGEIADRLDREGRSLRTRRRGRKRELRCTGDGGHEHLSKRLPGPVTKL